METFKRCKRCGRDLPLENFKYNFTTEDGYAVRCKECNSEHYQQKKERLFRGGIAEMDWVCKPDRDVKEKVKRIKYS